MRKFMLLLALAMLLQGCKATHYYRVTFQNGETDYFTLPYRVKKNAKTIEVDGEIILGIETIEEM